MDRNKGTKESPDVRSRLVVQEFASKDKEGLFAAPLPLEQLAHYCLFVPVKGASEQDTIR